jgi:hypothetical protein
MNARLWTHGWNFYIPGENIVFHLWSRSYRHNFNEIQVEERSKLKERSLLRVKYLLEMDKENPLLQFSSVEEVSKSLGENSDQYSLGRSRSIVAYQTFCGIDLQNQTIKESAKYGGLDKSLFMDTILELILQNTK